MQVSRHWRLQQQRYALVGQVCTDCEEKIFPPRGVCPNCAKETDAQFEFSGRGKVYSFSTVYTAPAGFEGSAPYTIGLVQLEEGPLITAQLTDIDNDHVEIGLDVEMVTRKLLQDGDRGVLVYGYKFRPVVPVWELEPEDALFALA